ncbi:RsiV family protein [Psychrobacter raelei]|uniref:RsiV family protein n=1 Tax=Psychrobacter raelei TaxID=2565531 RepID=UPI003F5EA81F
MSSTHLIGARSLRLFSICALAALTSFPLYAANLVYAEDYLDYRLPSLVTDTCESRSDYSCPQIDIKYAASSQGWINTLINARINQIVPGSQSETERTQPPSNAKVLTQAEVKKRLDGFAKSQLEDIPEGSSLNYSFEASPSYLGHMGEVELFEINSYIYLGGAHGLGASEYMMFDTSSKRHIQLDDILLAGQKSKFKALAYEQYKAWVRKDNNELKAYEKMWPFTLTDNALLTDKGVVLRYQPYEIAAYAYGMPELTVPYNQLKGILKPKYIPH